MQRKIIFRTYAIIKVIIRFIWSQLREKILRRALDSHAVGVRYSLHFQCARWAAMLFRCKDTLGRIQNFWDLTLEFWIFLNPKMKKIPSCGNLWFKAKKKIQPFPEFSPFVPFFVISSEFIREFLQKKEKLNYPNVELNFDLYCYRNFTWQIFRNEYCRKDTDSDDIEFVSIILQ